MTKTTSNKQGRFAIAPIALAIVSALSSVAYAQEQGEEADKKGIERIEVTAQKRVSSLQETPIAITALNSEAIENYGIEDIGDINSLAPNVRISPAIGSSFNVGINIRGLGVSEPSLAIDPKVGIYLDGVYLARNAGAIFNIVDLERVEVLRGPQGTLWGKNTTGGALSLVTKKPSDEFEFSQTFTAGSFNQFKSKTSIDTGAFGDFTAKFTYLHSEQDGWATNTFEGAKEKHLGSEDLDAMRFVLRYTGDTFMVDYSYDSTDSEAVSIPTQISNVRPYFADPTVPTLNLGNNTLYAGNVFAMMAANEHDASRQTEFSLDNHGPEKVDIEGHNLTIEWDFAENHMFKSISSYRDYKSHILDGVDLDGGAYMGAALDFTTMPPSLDYSNLITLPGFHFSGTKEQDQKSQEFQLIGDFINGQLKYVAGYYYFEEEGEEINPWALSIFTGRGANILFADPLPFGNFYHVSAESEAVFANFDYALTDQLNIIAGIRYTQDDRTLTNLSAPDVMLANDITSEKGWSKTVGSILANYVYDDDLTLYASIQQGYASGVYNPGSIDRFAFLSTGQANFEGTLTPSDPEDTTAYEIGMKSITLDDRLMVNTALFFNDNTNLQKTELDGTIRVSRNTGESETKGVEVDAQFLATPDLSFTVSLGYQDTEYTDPEYTDQTTYSGTLAMDWTVAELDWGDVLFHADYVLVDEYQFSVSDPTLIADAYELLNARISLANIDVGDRSSLNIAAWGRNITDEEYIVHGANMSFFDAQTYGAPASYGIDVRFDF
ncbi:TonB-dependent receptor [Thalassotalea maritima]|uniref:TonB-dependent receptor n=1 Tax=Thalassotalea maritima TaxID=3242416 RepID=UPI00352949D9